MLKRTLLALALILFCGNLARAGDALDEGFAAPPPQARMRAYWWWLNGNVNKAAITKDLEWMKRIGMGGALIFDAGEGAGPTPVGPEFGSPQWKELYKFAVQEASRLGLELTLSPQSGWNLGGPCVKPEEATKHIAWSETVIVGPAQFAQALATPKCREGFYRDTYVLAYPSGANAEANAAVPQVSASSAQNGHAPEMALDGDSERFWVSQGTNPGDGPTRKNPQWIQLSFAQPITLAGVRIVPRAGYGPSEGEWQSSSNGTDFTTHQSFSAKAAAEIVIRFPEITARHFRLLIRGSFDPRHGESRNVQICKIVPLDKNAQPINMGTASRRAKPIRQLEAKSMFHELGGSATDCSPLLEDIPGQSGEEDVLAKNVLDITSHLDRDGTLRWDVPAGTWHVLRFGYTLNGAHVSTSSGNWTGLVVDYLDADAVRSYWRQTVDPLLAEIGPLAGKTLMGFETDSWEAGGINWSAHFADEFRARRGYDIKPYLPVVAGKIVDNRDVSNRFLADLRKTVGDCMADNHYRVMSELAAGHGMYMHCEAAGPHAGPFDGLKNLGRVEQPMGEFWVQSPHRPTDESRFFGKVAACAAHVYGKKIACAEAFTSIGPHWDDIPWSSLKPTFDHEACAGVNLIYWHQFTCSPPEMGIPGQEYFAGTHFDPQITWANQAHGFVGYINRCQFMLQQGQFVADVCYYYGDHVPNIPGRKQVDPAKILPNYDYDVCPEEVLLTRMSVKDGRIVLPDGMSYRVLALPAFRILSLDALRKVRELVLAGATVVGPKPLRSATLTNYPACETEFKQIADDLWDSKRIVDGKTTLQALADLGVAGDFEAPADSGLDYIHRRTDAADIYFIRNSKPEPLSASCAFRVSGRQPEIWDAATGATRLAPAFTQDGGRTRLELEFAPFGSWFIVFREPIGTNVAGSAASNFPALMPIQEIAGPWSVQFDPAWGGPRQAVIFAKLQDWTERPEEGIKYYSGTARYRAEFNIPAIASGRRVYLDFGVVHEMLQATLNGKNLGVVWRPPWQVDATAALADGKNVLDLDVVNLWPNRLIGDGNLPPNQRLTKTNVAKFYTPPKNGQHKLMPSGLIGPVTLQEEAKQ